MVSLRFFRDNPGHMAMRQRGWWFERGKLDQERRRMGSFAGEQSGVAESDDALDLLQGLLTFNPGDRLTAGRALEHAYFR